MWSNIIVFHGMNILYGCAMYYIVAPIFWMCINVCEEECVLIQETGTGTKKNHNLCIFGKSRKL